MAIANASPTSSGTSNWFKPTTLSAWLLLCLLMLTACHRNDQAGAGAKKKINVSVGEIKEITLAGRSDGSAELIGTSDNQEVVEVSRRQLAPAVDTLNRNSNGPTVFQIKGVTVGTANVVFSKKPLGSSGAGEVMRTYVVQVRAK